VNYYSAVAETAVCRQSFFSVRPLSFGFLH